jgi:two-component system chemotaxis response regulator CheY
LIVDDSSLVRFYYRHALEKAGFEIELALNGIEAMEKVLGQRFDLAIVDINMPRMDGFSFIRALRRSAAEVATLPTLIITTEGGAQDIEDGEGGRCESLLGQACVGTRSDAHRVCAHESANMNPLQEQFIAEARELVQQATEDLIALERQGFAHEHVERVFRAFHTLKGSAGVVELPAMSLTLHAAEDVLAAYSKWTTRPHRRGNRQRAHLPRPGFAVGGRFFVQWSTPL